MDLCYADQENDSVTNGSCSKEDNDDWDFSTVTSEEIDNAEWLPGDIYYKFVMKELFSKENPECLD